MHVEPGRSVDVTALLERISQLQTALDSRIVIEQAKGVLAERFELTVDEAFLLLRYAARSSRTKLHDVAGEVVTSRSTPSAVSVAVARQKRWRAVGQRERTEAQLAKARKESVRARKPADKIRKSGKKMSAERS